MVTNNMNQAIKSTVVSSMGNAGIKKIAMNGTILENAYTLTSIVNKMYGHTVQSAYSFIVLGNGKEGTPTPEAVDLYAMDSIVGTELTVTAVTVTKPKENIFAPMVHIDIAVMNETEETVTFCEVGIAHSTNQGNAVTEATTWLWMREVIDPITLSPGESVSIGIDISMIQ